VTLRVFYSPNALTPIGQQKKSGKQKALLR